MVGIVLVSHSAELARGLAALAGQVAGSDVGIEPAGGDLDGGLGTTGTLVELAIARAEQGAGVLVLADLGSAILTVRSVLEQADGGRVRLADAPLVEGAIAAAVISAAGQPLEEVLRSAEEVRGASKF